MAVKERYSYTEWTKFGELTRPVYVGRDTFAAGSGIHVMFHNCATNEDLIYSANGNVTGDGVGCLTGHRYINVFAIAEKCSDPRIIVLRYPDFARVSVLIAGATEKYLAIVFTEGDHLVALNGLPNYEIQLWCWRTGEMLMCMKSGVEGANQRLVSSPAQPVFVAQLGEQMSKMVVWEVNVGGGQGFLTRQEVQVHRPGPPHNKPQMLPFPVWAFDSTLYLVLKDGDVARVSMDTGVLEKTLTWPGQPGSQVPHGTWYKNGVVIYGPEGDLRMFTRNFGPGGAESWTQEWVVTIEAEILRVGWAYARDTILLWSNEGVYYESKPQEDDNTEIEFTEIIRFNTFFKDIDIICPLMTHIVTVNNHNQLALWLISTGEEVSKLDVHESSMVMVSNPKMPYAAVGRDDGVLSLVNVFDVQHPKIMVRFRLTDQPIDLIRFSQRGRYIVASSMESGEIFVVTGTPGRKMEIMYYIEMHYQIVTLACQQVAEDVRVAALLVTNDNFLAGDKLLCYTLPMYPDKALFSQKYALAMNRMYKNVRYCNDNPEATLIFAVPHMSRMIHILDYSHNSTWAVLLIRVKVSGHQLRNINFTIDEFHTVSNGMDGLICIHEAVTEQPIAVVVPHHRMDGGVRNASVDSFRERVISIGRCGTVVSTRLVGYGNAETAARKKIAEAFMSEPETIAMFTERETIGFFDSGPVAFLFQHSWVDRIVSQRVAEEELQCRAEREAIIQEFCDLRDKVIDLLEINFDLPPEEILPIQAFNLDTDTSDVKIKKAKESREQMKQYLEASIVAQDLVTNWIIDTTYNRMHIKGQVIRAIGTNFEVENYAMPPADPKFQHKLAVLQTLRSVEKIAALQDLFRPWLPKTPAQLKAELEREPRILDPDKARLSRALRETDQDEDSDEMDMRSVDLPTGDSAKQYIATNESRYPQFEVATIDQMKIEETFSERDEILLREFFNRTFIEMYALKEREMHVIADKNSRLRHIISEQNILAELRDAPDEKLDLEVEDPPWSPAEKPDKIVTVTDDEVEVQRYISPSEQNLLDKQAAEEERLRLLLLADDFKERALIAMMNGVLEVLWEDEIKKTPPTPKCMNEKRPEEYNEDDLKAIRDYKEKIDFLNSERDKYKKMLQAEFEKVTKFVNVGVQKFNQRLADFLDRKLKVDSAVKQECLKISRNRRTCVQRIQFIRKERELEADVAVWVEEVNAMQERVNQLQERAKECRKAYEVMNNRDRQLDRNFKTNFEDRTAVVQELATKAFRKRPRWSQKLMQSPVVLMQLARCCVSDERPLYMPQDAWEFLRAMEQLDYHTQAPKALDDNTWKLMVKLRTQKLEAEIKSKALALDLAEVENTHQVFQKKLVRAKEKHLAAIAALKAHREERIASYQDMEIQLVMKTGLVEVDLTGDLDDFKDAILISRRDVEGINDIIKHAGLRKIRTMQSAINFRRKILMKEWEHKYMRMRIEDLKDNFMTIDNVKVSKEIQAYLKRRYMGIPESVGPLALEKELDAIRRKMNKIIDGIKNDCRELDTKIKQKKSHSKQLDKLISELNISVNEKNLKRDLGFEKHVDNALRMRMNAVMTRARLVKRIQDQQCHLVELQTELELLRLRTYPNLHYRMLQEHP